MKRVSVVGISGSGKSTLAARLAAHIGARHVELDSIFHQPGWTPLPREEFRAHVGEVVAGESWVIDGNYGSNVQDVVWDAADTVIWLDLERRTILPRILARTLRRIWNREELWNGNREHWSNLFDPRPEENVVLWMLTQHRRQRRRNNAGLASARWSHLDVRRLRTPGQVEQFRATLAATGPS
jgi:adenylate kinase family enzyme